MTILITYRTFRNIWGTDIRTFLDIVHSIEHSSDYRIEFTFDEYLEAIIDKYIVDNNLDDSPY